MPTATDRWLLNKWTAEQAMSEVLLWIADGDVPPYEVDYMTKKRMVECAREVLVAFPVREGAK